MVWANDAFANATLLTGASGSITPFHYDGTTDPATSETGEDLFGAGETLWWKWVAPGSGTVTFDTLGSTDDGGAPEGLDTKMQAFVTSFTTAHRITFNDDADGTTYNSQVTFSATAGTTYYIQVDQFSTGQAGTLHLSWSWAPPAPTLSDVRDATDTTSITQALVGSDVVLHGTGLDSVTAVHFGPGDATAWTINSPTQITATVPTTGRSTGGLTVTSPGGTSNSLTFTPLFLGPWIQPADTVGNTSPLGGSGTVEVDFAYGSSTLPDYPDATATLIDRDSATPWWEILLIDTSGGDPDHWRWRHDVGILAVDVTTTIDTDDGTILAPITPSSADITAAGALTYELEADIGTPTGPLHLTTTGIGAGTEHNFPDGLYTAPDPGVYEAAHMNVYQLPSSWYDWVTSGLVSRPTLDRWHTGPEIGALPLLSAITTSDGVLHTPGGLPATEWYSDSDETYALDVTITTADLDAGRYGLLFALDMLIDETKPPLPTPGGTPVYDQMHGGVVAASLTLGITYRPPRYRYVFTEPQTTTGWQVGSVAMT